eukprot:GHVT01080673.1.p2 GENE.GHVT01080673.1~~GHVT01080673.1.p2  ORF type:complete len:135 (-),score=25.95 GHVT01080673.1:4828-5232(-)
MLPKTNASSRGISPAAALILGDAQKKIVDPAFRKREKALGLLPQNQDSPFGNFPDDYKTANKARPPRSSSIPPLFARGEGKQVQNPLAGIQANHTATQPIKLHYVCNLGQEPKTNNQSKIQPKNDAPTPKSHTL